jgi:hypothetical protein
MEIPRILRPALRRLVPDRMRTLRGDRRRRGIARATQRLWEASGGRVMGGPFAGLVYLPTHYSQLGPKLLGSYESELHGIIPALTRPGTRHLVNVGAGEGYYACGLLRAAPQMRVTAYESSEEARRLMQEMARRNRLLPRLVIRGACDTRSLAEILSTDPGSPVLMDVEGAEVELLDPGTIPDLRSVPVLVETHDHLHRGLTALLIERFGPSHHIERIPAVEAHRRALPVIPGFSRQEIILAAFERSAEDQEWLWMVPRGLATPAPGL